jgi:hypothetical protein
MRGATWPPLEPNPVPTATCSSCGHVYTTRTPDAGCLSPVAVPIATLVSAEKCERCYRRNVNSTTAGRVNQKFGSVQRGPG